MPSMRRAHLLSALACALVLAGCSADEEPAADEAPVVQLGAPGEDSTTLSPEEVDEIEGPTYTEADVAFVQAMLPHHQQALEMNALVADRAADSDLALLAERIDVSQLDEIGQLEAWLTARDESVPGEHDHHGSDHAQMPGMLTEPEMAQLERSSGRRFDRLFLQYMIRHHEGAVAMVEELLTAGLGGQESAVFQLAGHIASDQQVEISRMKKMLLAL